MSYLRLSGLRVPEGVALAFSLALQPPVAGITSNWCLLCVLLLLAAILIPAVNNNEVNTAVVDPSPSPVAGITSNWFLLVLATIVIRRSRFLLSGPLVSGFWMGWKDHPESHSVEVPVSTSTSTSTTEPQAPLPPPPWVRDFCHIFETEHIFVVSNVEYLAPQPPGNGKDLDPGELFHLDLLKKTSWATDRFWYLGMLPKTPSLANDPLFKPFSIPFNHLPIE
ncbi:hypothetical protein QCA50_001185 [Cerrena zonata]|uniref:Uncharacterized protein n=1 Tax=Cerrena zonata TaxID=2478898 RepID=A0AAW0GW59_9APHY